MTVTDKSKAKGKEKADEDEKSLLKQGVKRPRLVIRILTHWLVWFLKWYPVSDVTQLGHNACVLFRESAPAVAKPTLRISASGDFDDLLAASSKTKSSSGERRKLQGLIPDRIF